MVAEGDALWIRILNSRTDGERVQLFGSRRRYYTSMAAMLDTTPYKQAADHARRQIPSATSKTLVSVVVPFCNDALLARRAIRSALAQTHPLIEVIAVHDGSADDLRAIEDLAWQDKRLRLVHQENLGPGAARNRGMREASGDYIAFLDADDTFLQHKVQRQLQLMQQTGQRVSHTSYYVSCPSRGSELGLMHSGEFSGSVYPRIIAECPIAMSTVMLHHSVFASGFEFPTGSPARENVMAWIELAMRHEILGINELLSLVEWSETSDALSPENTILGLMNVLARVCANPLHSRHTQAIGDLTRDLHDVTKRWKADPQAFTQSMAFLAFGAAA